MCNPSFTPPLDPSSFDTLSSSPPSDSHNYFRHPWFRRPSLRSMTGFSTTAKVHKQRSPLFVDVDDDDDSESGAPGYFLDCCHLCKTPLHADDDIYMYQGDTPFCTEECRQEQIDIDEAAAARERKNKSKKVLKAEISENSAASNKSPSYEIHVTVMS